MQLNFLGPDKERQRVFAVLCLSALVATLFRLLSPLQVEWDLGIQLEAAHRFAQGQGLTNVFYPSLDLNQPPTPLNLTHFPPGLSLMVAALLSLGLSLGTALKLIYAPAMVFGWVGWGVIASSILSRGIKLRHSVLPLQYPVAVLLPLFYTPSWTMQGTDSLLWAGTPWVALLLFKSRARPGRTRLLIAAGLLVGLLFAIRYASVFLLLGGFLVLYQVNFPKFKAFLSAYLTFCLASLAVVGPAFVYAKLAVNTGLNNFLATHRGGSLDNDSPLALVGEFVTKTVSNLSGLAEAFGPPVNRLPIASLLEITPANYAYGTLLLLVLVGLPLWIVRSRRLNQDTLAKDELLTLALLEVSLVIFLIALTFPLDYSPLSIERYYDPLNIAPLLIIYGMASSRDFGKLIKPLAIVFVVAFLAYNLNLGLRDLMLGRTMHRMSGGLSEEAVYRWPGNQVVARNQEGLQQARAIREQYPDALIFVQSYPYYVYDGSSTFRSIPDPEFWQQAYLSQDTKLFWILQEGDCNRVCSSIGNFNMGWPRPIEAINRIPSLEIYQTFPADPDIYKIFDPPPTVIFTADLPAGYRFGDQAEGGSEVNP